MKKIKSYECTLPDGRVLTPSMQFKVSGEQEKWYDFICQVTTEKGDTWIDAFGGRANKQRSRSFMLDRVTQIRKKPKKKD